MNLFRSGDFTLSSGEKSDFKIDCDYLSNEDLYTIAEIVGKRITFGKVSPVPSGGNRFAEALSQFKTPDSNVLLIVDDVCTTGGSFERHRESLQHLYQQGWFILGICIFCRNPEKKPGWVTSVFDFSLYNEV